MKIVGFERSDFTVKESGDRITGFNVYIGRQIVADRGRGQAVDRIYLSDRKISESNIHLEELQGKEVVISYNRYGKVQTIVLA